MSSEKKAKCCKCGNNLSQYELSDNVYVGLNENEYVCYSCQSDVDGILEDNLNFDDEDD